MNAVLPAALIEWGAFLIQSALLFGPALVLARQSVSLAHSHAPAARADALVIHTTLWACGLVLAGYWILRGLSSIYSGPVYSWPFAGCVHLLLSAGAARVLRRLTPRPNTSTVSDEAAAANRTRVQSDPLSLAATALVFGTVLAGALLNLRTPPGGWDALTYHLDFPARWVAHARIFLPVTGYGDYSPSYYPMLIEAVVGWYLLPAGFTGLPPGATADLVQLLFVPLLFCALRDLLRSLRPAGDPLIRLVPLFALSLPYFQSSLLVADNDFALCALLAAVLRASWPSRLRRPIELAAAVALSASVKYTALIYLAALLVPLALAHRYRCLRQTPRDAAHPPGLPAVVATIGALLLLGSGTYLMNWITTGSPLYPAIIEIAGWRPFDSGYYPRAFFEDHPFHRIDAWALLSNPGFSLALWLLPLSVLVYTATVLARRVSETPVTKGRVAGLLALALPILAGLAFYLWIPLRQPRLALPVVLLACLAPIAWPGRAAPAGAGPLFLVGAMLIHSLVSIARFAELFGNPLPGHLSLALNEIRRDTILSLAQLPLAHVALHTLFWLLGAALIISVLYWQRAQARTRLRWPLWIGAFAVCTLAALCISEQRPVVYAGDGAAAAFRKYAVRTMAEPGEVRRKTRLGVIGTHAIFGLRASLQDDDVRLLLNRPNGERPLHARDESLVYDETEKRWVAIGTLAMPEVFAENLRASQWNALLLATTPGTNGLWPAEYEWLQSPEYRVAGWQCDAPFANASYSGDGGARMVFCWLLDSKKNL